MSISGTASYPLVMSLGVTPDPLISFYPRTAYMCPIDDE